MMEEKLKSISVLIVNDSGYMRTFLANLISTNKILTDFANNGQDALNKMSIKEPDVILLDLEMPKMDGLTFITKMARTGKIIPTIIVSSFSKKGSKLVLDALENGAVDYVRLPENSTNSDKLKLELISKIETAYDSDPIKLITEKIFSLPKKKPPFIHGNYSQRILIIGASTGGPSTVQKVLSQLPSDLSSGILLVQHMPKSFTKQFANRLSQTTGFVVKEAEEGDKIIDGQILLAPGDYHMLIQDDRTIHLDSSEKRFGVRPSVNMTMVSASEVYGANTVGVILTGMGHDGAFGMKTIKKRNGRTIVQDEKTCVIYGMPKAVVELDAADSILPVDQIPDKIIEEVTTLVRE